MTFQMLHLTFGGSCRLVCLLKCPSDEVVYGHILQLKVWLSKLCMESMCALKLAVYFVLNVHSEHLNDFVLLWKPSLCISRWDLSGAVYEHNEQEYCLPSLCLFFCGFLCGFQNNRTNHIVLTDFVPCELS